MQPNVGNDAAPLRYYTVMKYHNQKERLMTQNANNVTISCAMEIPRSLGNVIKKWRQS